MREKVQEVRIHNLPIFVPVVNKHYSRIREELFNEYDITIPTMMDMKLDKNVLWYVSVVPFSVTVMYKTFEYRFHFYKGFMTDNGSIPHFLQSFITNNNPMAVVGFFCHDLMYQTKALGKNKKAWKKANEIMADILLWYGLNPITNQITKSAVDSPIGWINYIREFERDTTTRGRVKFIKYNRGKK